MNKEPLDSVFNHQAPSFIFYYPIFWGKIQYSKNTIKKNLESSTLQKNLLITDDHHVRYTKLTPVLTICFLIGRSTITRQKEQWNCELCKHLPWGTPGTLDWNQGTAEDGTPQLWRQEVDHWKSKLNSGGKKFINKMLF